MPISMCILQHKGKTFPHKTDPCSKRSCSQENREGMPYSYLPADQQEVHSRTDFCINCSELRAKDAEGAIKSHDCLNWVMFWNVPVAKFGEITSHLKAQSTDQTETKYLSHCCSPKPLSASAVDIIAMQSICLFNPQIVLILGKVSNMGRGMAQFIWWLQDLMSEGAGMDLQV